MAGLRHKYARAITTVAILAVSMIGACKNSNRPAAKTRTQAGTLAPRDTTAAHRDTAVSNSDVVRRDSSAALVAGKWINDANALALLSLMSSRQIAAAQRELAAWHSDTVRAFAEASMHEHRAIQHAVDSVAAITRIAPVSPALAATVGATMQAQIDSMQGGRLLDRSFIRQQIVGHELMATYAEQLAAVAERPEVQSVMSLGATRARAQLDRARAVQAGFVAADSIVAADSAAKANAKAAADSAARARAELRKKRSAP